MFAGREVSEKTKKGVKRLHLLAGFVAYIRRNRVNSFIGLWDLQDN
jgi:hypothetical protein